MKEIDLTNKPITISQSDFLNIITEEQEELYFKRLEKRLDQEEEQNIVVPRKEHRLRWIDEIDISTVKVFIINDYPSAAPVSADGYAFSSEYGVSKELERLYRRIEIELGIDCKRTGNLERWREQGVCLINTIETAQLYKKRSHKEIGWKRFNYNVVQKIYSKTTKKVFIFIGEFGQEQETMFKETSGSGRHLVITLDSINNRGFFKKECFPTVNKYIKKYYNAEIDWR